MYDPYETLLRLNAAALRRCEEHWLDPDADGRGEEESEEEEPC